MTTLRDLATIIHYKHDVDADSAESALHTYIEQIEHLDGRTIDPDDIDPDTAEFLIDAYASAQRSGDLGHREMGRLEDHIAQLQAFEEQRDPLIREALHAGARVKDVCAATGLSRERIRQIRGAK